MSVTCQYTDPEIRSPAWQHAVNRAFLLGYNARVRSQTGGAENPFLPFTEPRQHAAWREGWDRADKTGLLVKLPA